MLSVKSVAKIHQKIGCAIEKLKKNEKKTNENKNQLKISE